VGHIPLMSNEDYILPKPYEGHILPKPDEGHILPLPDEGAYPGRSI